MTMFRHIKEGWTCANFGEFAQLVHQRNTNQDVHDFIEYTTSPIPWELCGKAEPILRAVVQDPIFRETGHQETAIALCDAMKKCAESQVNLKV